MLVALWMLWNTVLLPAAIAIWRSDTVLQLRLAAGGPDSRVSALRNAAAKKPASEALVLAITEVMSSDRVPEVRAAAARTLGDIGRGQVLPNATRRGLIAFLDGAEDDSQLAAAIEALGASAARNRHADELVLRIAQTLAEPHSPWLYGRAAYAIGQIGAAQSLSAEVVAVLNTVFVEPRHPGLKEDLVRAFLTIADEASLAVSTLDLLARTLQQESDDRIRVPAVLALAHAERDYPTARRLVTEALHDSSKEVRSAAQQGSRVMNYNRDFAGRDPMAMALNRSLPREKRLKAIRLVRPSRDEETAGERFSMLLDDDDVDVVVAALEKLHFLSGSPADKLDREVLIPKLTVAMPHPDSDVRRAAQATLSRMFVHNHRYRDRADDFRAHLDAAARDPAGEVRVVAFATMLRVAAGTEERDAIRERALVDPDFFVRRHAVGWLGDPESVSRAQPALLDRALKDPDESVRQAAVAAEREWNGRKRHWLLQLWRLWQDGEYSKLGVIVLAAVTLAAPVLVGGTFLIYFMARLLSYLLQRRWRALAVVPVMAAWAAASYGMFMLYFMAAHVGHPGPFDILQVAGILWIAVVAYAALGWAMHYAIRR